MWNDVITIALSCLSIGANILLVSYFHRLDAHTAIDKERDSKISFLEARYNYLSGKLGIEFTPYNGR